MASRDQQGQSSTAIHRTQSVAADPVAAAAASAQIVDHRARRPYRMEASTEHLDLASMEEVVQGDLVGRRLPGGLVLHGPEGFETFAPARPDALTPAEMIDQHLALSQRFMSSSSRAVARQCANALRKSGRVGEATWSLIIHAVGDGNTMHVDNVDSDSWPPGFSEDDKACYRSAFAHARWHGELRDLTFEFPLCILPRPLEGSMRDPVHRGEG